MKIFLWFALCSFCAALFLIVVVIFNPNIERIENRKWAIYYFWGKKRKELIIKL